MDSEIVRGHAAALFTALVWGTTFISTKLLLIRFSPIEILFLRFLLGYAALLLACPRKLAITDKRQELTFAAAGLCGVTLYYLLENIALSLSLASNVGVIVSVAPCFTALLMWALPSERQRPGGHFLLGFVLAMAGIVLISVNGSQLQLNPAGDLLAVLAAVAWAFYSVLTKRIGSYGYPVLLTTRRIFFYGTVFMLPVLPVFGFSPDTSALTQPLYIFNFLFLGLVACAACFVTWNYAVSLLGPVKTSVYIYLVPVITSAASALILGEPITPLAAIGAALTLLGLVLSQRRGVSPQPAPAEEEKE